MVLPVIKVVVTADTAQAEAGAERVEQGFRGVGAAADKASVKTNALGSTMVRAGRSGARFQHGLQNAAFQVGDFAVQVGGGVDASRALAQQLPQLLGGLGVLGAVMGAVAAIAIPLSLAFKAAAKNGTDLTGMLGTLSPAMASLASAMTQVKAIMVSSAEAIINNIDRIVITAGVAATFFAGKWVAGFVAARIATFTLAGALTALRVALIRTGIGALIVGAGELVYQFSRLAQAAGSVGEAIGLIKDVFVEVWQRIKIVAAAGIDYLIGQFHRMQAAWIGAVANMGSAISDLFWGMSDGMRGSGIPMLEGMADGLQKVALRATTASAAISHVALGHMNESGDLLAAATGGFADASAPLESVQKIRDVLAGIKEERLTLPDLLGVGSGDGEDGEGGGGKSAASKKLDEELTAQEERIKTHFDRIKALSVGGLSDKLGAWGNYFDGLISLTGSKNEKLFAIAKTAKAAQAFIDAWSAYNQVLADPALIGNPLARIAAAGNVLAAGLGAVNAITSASSSGSTSSGGGGGGSASTATAGTVSTLNANVRFTGDPSFASQPGAIGGLADALMTEFSDRGITVVTAQ